VSLVSKLMCEGKSSRLGEIGGGVFFESWCCCVIDGGDGSIKVKILDEIDDAGIKIVFC
jgi:hypothetical protein